MTTEQDNISISRLKTILKKMTWSVWMIAIVLLVIVIMLISGVSINTLGTDITRNAILLAGVLGGAYGLDLATRRQETFQAQLFNEQLGRGVELTANDNLSMRTAGLRVLDNLAASIEQDNEDNKELILYIISDLIREKCIPAKLGAPIPQRADMLDLQLAIEILLRIQHDINNTEDLLAGLNLQELDFSYKELDSANFSHARLDAVNFQWARLDGVRMRYARLNKINFSLANLENANFFHTKFKDTKLSCTKLYMATLRHARLDGVDFEDAELTGADFSGTNLYSVTNLSQDQIDTIIYNDNNLPRNVPKNLKLPARAFICERASDGKPIYKFVKSSEPWSEQPVNEWIEKEIENLKAQEEPLFG